MKLLLALLFLAACSTQPGTVRVEGAFARPVLAAGDAGAIYLELVNSDGFADRLVSASTSLAGSVETHESVETDGISRMLPRIEGFLVPARGRLALTPGGKHLMLFNVRRALAAGDTIPLQLKFERAGTVDLQVPVRGF